MTFRWINLALAPLLESTITFRLIISDLALLLAATCLP